MSFREVGLSRAIKAIIGSRQIGSPLKIRHRPKKDHRTNTAIVQTPEEFCRVNKKNEKSILEERWAKKSLEEISES